MFVDAELGNEAFTYVLGSGNEGSVHLDHVREYNEEPQFMANLLLYNLTLEAEERAADSPLSRRHIARQLNTSVPQLYRLLDQANTNKSMKQLVALLHVLDCDVDLVVLVLCGERSGEATEVVINYQEMGLMDRTVVILNTSAQSAQARGQSVRWC